MKGVERNPYRQNDTQGPGTFNVIAHYRNHVYKGIDKKIEYLKKPRRPTLNATLTQSQYLLLLYCLRTYKFAGLQSNQLPYLP